jgi:hypothetical protein
MKQIAQGKLGAIGEYTVNFEDGKVKVHVEVDVAGEGITALEAAIPGKIDDAVLEIVRALLKSV